MKINPYEMHPESESLLEKEKEFWTKNEILIILDEESEAVRTDETPKWGYKKSDMVDLLTMVRVRIEEM